ncbi:sensor histidine kinase, partial [Patulibacter minatonensis]|uniref:sensor histidine kinase n=1 Tax=Patulibacter minatonensis TaxID=298163 RepID=UPI0006851F06
MAAAAALAALIALLAAGVFVLTSATASDRSDLDDALSARAQQAAKVGRNTVRTTGVLGRPAVRATRRVGRILGPVTGSGDVALIRIVRGGEVLDRLGGTADPGLPLSAPNVPTTVSTPEGDWRIVQRAVGRGLVVQAASPLTTLDARRNALRDRLLLAGAGGVLGTALLAFLLAGPALGALTRLRRDAGRVATTADLDVRMPDTDGPAEVRELAATLNAMLARLERSDADRRAALDTTQRFAADAGHELRTPLTALTTTVEALRSHPDLPVAERTAMLDEIAEEHARLVDLLDALQALARGDAGARTDRGPVDLAELAEQAVEAARTAAPGTTFVLDAPGTLVVDGWAPGLRMVLDNLLVNAVRHGRSGGTVAVRVVAAGPGAVLTVDDDGPGIPVDEREAVRGRFARGRG